MPILALLIAKELSYWAVFFLALASFTDYLDGWFARRRKQETKFGKLMDPVADKILLCVALIFLVAQPSIHLSPWLACLLLAREFLITGLRAVASSMGVVVAAGGLGKLKVVFQYVGLGSVILGNHRLGFPAGDFGILLLWTSVMLSYWSMVIYIRNAYLLLSQRDAL